jgi:nondiscriminating glutamyl-tRNA synthetase
MQSERLPIYHEYIEQLLANGHAYYCFTTEDELEAHKKKAEEAGIMIPFRSPYRDITTSEAKAKIAAGEKYVIRMKIPKGETITFNDGLKGKISVPSADVDDQVLIKTDGFPTYHLAMAVDDHLMKITHVLRGDEWLPSTPKHVLLYRMFGWEAPEFWHLSVILGADRKKLSKRNGDTHVSQFLEQGYIKKALLNYIALIGWNSKTTKEIFSLPELIEAFSLDGLQIANGIFDPEKLKWMNGKYIAATPVDSLYETLSEYLKKYAPDFYENTLITHDEKFNKAVLAEVQKRLETLADFPSLTDCFYSEPEVDPKLLLSEKMGIANLSQAKEALEFGLKEIEALPP